MNRKWIFAGLIVVAVLFGSGVALLTTNSLRPADEPRTQKRIASIETDPAAHFTSYEPQNYPDLTYAAENAVNAVVNIEVTQEVEMRSVDPFLELFGIPQGYSRGGLAPREVTPGGSGVIL